MASGEATELKPMPAHGADNGDEIKEVEQNA